jgi:cytochrome c2
MFGKLQIALIVALSLMFACACPQSGYAGETQKLTSPTKILVIKPKGYIPKPITVESQKGQHYYDEAHCSVCHSVDDVGAAIGPVLDGIGQYRNFDFLFARLSNTPEAQGTYGKLTGQSQDNLAPHVRMSPLIARSLVAYLLTLPEPSGGFAVYPHKFVAPEPPRQLDFQLSPKTASSDEGKKLYEQFGCAQCHQIQHAGGYIAPSLDGIGRHSRGYIAAHITDAQMQDIKTDKFFELVPTSMPKFAATPEQIRKITDYLMTLPER